MKRNQAIEVLVLERLKNLSPKERSEQLETMKFEDRSESKDWLKLSNDIKSEFKKGKLKDNPNAEKYDEVLKIWLREGLQYVTNEFLCTSLKVDSIEGKGKQKQLLGCPCCGSCTISERGDYEVCKVCWWEDDGQDNHDADEVLGGPNYVSLTDGRYNFLKYGIYNPTRKDLIKLKEPIAKYGKSREFEIIGKYIFEKRTNRKGEVKIDI